MSRPLVVELFCGRFGWSKGFVANGYRSIGFDISHEDYHGPVPEGCELALQDVLTLHGSQLKDARAIVCSPPCQEYSYMAMPFSLGKKKAKEYRDGTRDVADLTRLFDACFRIQREASEAAGRHIPMVVENVKGAQPWVGPAKAHFGSFYLWGDVESVGGRIVAGGLRFGQTLRPVRGVKAGGDWFGPGENCSPMRKCSGSGGTKQAGLSGPAWFDGGAASLSSGSSARKAASAMIAEIPFALSDWIARCFHPDQAPDRGSRLSTPPQTEDRVSA